MKTSIISVLRSFHKADNNKELLPISIFHKDTAFVERWALTEIYIVMGNSAIQQENTQ